MSSFNSCESTAGYKPGNSNSVNLDMGSQVYGNKGKRNKGNEK